jgi:hypothetical protein
MRELAVLFIMSVVAAAMVIPLFGAVMQGPTI